MNAFIVRIRILYVVYLERINCTASAAVDSERFNVSWMLKSKSLTRNINIASVGKCVINAMDDSCEEKEIQADMCVYVHCMNIYMCVF